MAIATLTAIERNDAAKKLRREGFTPGVIYGFGHEEGRPVQFKASTLLATIKKNGTNARVNVEVDGKGEYGAIKEVQLHPVTNQIRHIDIQVFSKEDIVKLTVPIHYTGADELRVKRFVVGTLMNEIEITGPAMNIPQSLAIDLSEKSAGDVITVADLGINEDLKISGEMTDTLVTITEAVAEPDAETDEAEAVVTEEKTEEA
ncbi:MAG TPA: 50S ribosomal protein L25 [Epulopiscium sp.]|nr:50S ribosomal protein L25 [Candidatus Epulonipiscium sp.]